MLFPSTASSVGITASGESSGHGQTLDLGVIDEAFAQKDERLVQAFRPAMMTRPSAQLWIVSTMGHEDSLFFHDRVDDGRARVEAGERSGVAFFEWSAHDDDDPDEASTWWSCMPALGYTVNEATIRADHDGMPPDEFARAYLNRRTAAALSSRSSSGRERATSARSSQASHASASTSRRIVRSVRSQSQAGELIIECTSKSSIIDPALSGSSIESQSLNVAGTLGLSSSTLRALPARCSSISQRSACALRRSRRGTIALHVRSFTMQW